jgi:hypothetical protein
VAVGARPISFLAILSRLERGWCVILENRQVAHLKIMRLNTKLQIIQMTQAPAKKEGKRGARNGKSNYI